MILTGTVTRLATQGHLSASGQLETLQPPLFIFILLTEFPHLPSDTGADKNIRNIGGQFV